MCKFNHDWVNLGVLCKVNRSGAGLSQGKGARKTESRGQSRKKSGSYDKTAPLKDPLPVQLFLGLPVVFLGIFFFLFHVLGTEPRYLAMLGRCYLSSWAVCPAPV